MAKILVLRVLPPLGYPTPASYTPPTNSLTDAGEIRLMAQDQAVARASYHDRTPPLLRYSLDFFRLPSGSLPPEASWATALLISPPPASKIGAPILSTILNRYQEL